MKIKLFKTSVLLLFISSFSLGKNEEQKNFSKNKVEKNYKNGTFTGASPSSFSNVITAEVTIKDNKIKNIVVVSHSDTKELVEPAFELIIMSVIENQTSNVDVVAGASGSSRALINAIKIALSKANLEESDIKND